MSFKQTFKPVIPYMIRAIPKFLIGLAALFAVDLVQLYVPKIMQHTIDRLGTPDFFNKDVTVAVMWIIGLTFLMAISRYFWRIAIIGNAWSIERDMRKDFYDHLITLDKNYFNRHKTGDLMAHAINDLQAVRMFFGMGFIASADLLIMSVMSLYFMTHISLKLTLFAIIPLPLLSFVIIFLGKKMHKKSHDVQESFSEMSGFIQESISGIRVVKAFAQEKPELSRLSIFAKDYIDKSLSLIKIQAVFHPLMGTIIGLSMAVALVIGGTEAMKGNISTGEFLAFFSYLGMLAWPMMAIGIVINQYQRATASLKRLNKIYNTQPEVTDEDADQSLTEIKGKLEIKNLSFRYSANSPLIFDKINTFINPGETLAIVGHTGCGKTTLIDLLTRLYNPPKNSIFIDDNDVFKYPLKVLRKHIVMVPQDIFLFSDSILENIRLGNPQASKEEVIIAAKKADVHKDIIGFENGYETVVGERGVTLSGGQKQRIAIARAILTNPNVLILDDSLSAVDTKTEEKILSELIEDRKGKTTIIIAHRLSSLKHAEKIIVLDGGKIIESGNHEELLQHHGMYANIFEKQQIEEKIEQE